jgi:DNA-binding MarR family transcriptional regulator
VVRTARSRLSGPSVDRIGVEEPFQRLREAMFLMRSRWRRELEQFDLTYSDYLVLAVCARGPARASEVARALGVTPAATTDALDRLERRTLVRRSPDPKDRRGVRIRLTPAGSRLVRQTRTAKRATMRYLRDAMSATEREALAVGLGALTRALRQPRGA